MRSPALVLVGLFAVLFSSLAGAPGSGAARAATKPEAGLIAAKAPVSDVPAVVPPAMPTAISLTKLGTYASNSFDKGGAEIVTHDPVSQRLYIVNGATQSIDIVNIGSPASPVLSTTIALSPTYGAKATSVDMHNGVLAVAVEAQTPTDAGKVAFFDRDGRPLKQVTVGVLPDMVTFTPDGSKVLTANEGQPTDDYLIDPEGTVTIIDMASGVANATPTEVRFIDFNQGGPRNGELPGDVRIFGPGASVAQDLEPEYIAVSPDGQTAFVTLQENNAIAEIDIDVARVTAIRALGFKDHNVAGNGLDASNRDDRINIRPWPVKGMYMPDAIAAYDAQGKTYLVTANEGDARDYGGFGEEARIGDDQIVLDPARFPNAADLKSDTNLGRLQITTTLGKNAEGEYEELYSYGARSFSIRDGETGALVFDSGDDMEQRTAELLPEFFNSTNDDNASFDNRSDDKGPEPEGVVIGTIGGRTYAFVGLERIGGVMVYDVTTPASPTFVLYVNNRDFSAGAGVGSGGDLGPEGLVFVPGNQSPTGFPLLIVANEVSGTTTIYGITTVSKNKVYLPLILHSEN